MNRRKEARIARAEERAEARGTRSPQQQLAILDQRLGPGIGAEKERARLQKEIDNEHTSVA